MDVFDTTENQYDAAIALLKQLQANYHSAREQLHNMSLQFGKEETLAGQQLHLITSALESINTGKSNITGIDIQTIMLSGQFLRQSNQISQPVKKSPRPNIQAYCLGKFEVWINSEVIESWKSIKAKSLFKYLLIQHGGPVSRELLTEVLWPDCPPNLGNNNLKATVRVLRQTLRSAQDEENDFTWVSFRDGYYMINEDVDLWLDIDQFEHHWKVGRLLEKQGRMEEAISEYKKAEVLYKGDFLEDEVYNEWTMIKREGLKDIYLIMLTKLAKDSIQQEDYDGCISYCLKILYKDICREDAYQYLMCSYSRLGQRSRAIKWYNLCEKVIKTELDIKPQQSTIDLYHKLINDEII